MSEPRRIVNLADVPLTDAGNGNSFQARIGRIGRMLGLGGLGCTLTVVPPGKRGVHSYELSDYGLDAREVAEEFAFYTERYDLAGRVGA